MRWTGFAGTTRITRISPRSIASSTRSATDHPYRQRRRTRPRDRTSHGARARGQPAARRRSRDLRAPGGRPSPRRKRCWIRARPRPSFGTGWDPLGGIAATSGRRRGSGWPCAGSSRRRSHSRRRRCRVLSSERRGPHSTRSPIPMTAATRAPGRCAVVPGLARAPAPVGGPRVPPGRGPRHRPTPQCFRLLPQLFLLESQGFSDELVRWRKALRDISPSFFRAYRRLVMEQPR